MKKQEVIQKLKNGMHAIFMDRKDAKDVELLRGIVKEAFPTDITKPSGVNNFYFKSKNYEEWDYENTKHLKDLLSIKITEITDEENLANFYKLVSNEVSPALSEMVFKSGELVEGWSYNCVKWNKGYYVGKTTKGLFAIENKFGIIKAFNKIRKINPVIEQIRKLMKENNISKEEI